MRDWTDLALLALSAVGVVTGATAQTTVNNTVNNNSTSIVIKQSVIVHNSARAAPAPRPAPPPPAPQVFPYQPRELLPYMSPRCAQLYELELSPARRTPYAVGAGVRNEFRSDCPDAINEARKSLFQNKASKYNAAQDQKLAATNAAAQDKMSKDQCSELLRILANKRKRLDSMTDGEKADHARSEENYAARCKSS